MEWILNHLQFVFVAIFFVGSWIVRRMKERAEREKQSSSTARLQRRVESKRADRAEDEIRRVQEEIRRKILERAGGGRSQPQTSKAPEPSLRPPVRPVQPPPVPASRPTAEQARQIEAAAMRHEQMLDELRRLEEKKAETKRYAEQVARSRKEAAASVTLTNLSVAELRDPNAIRRAVVLREVLGPPASLRGR